MRAAVIVAAVVAVVLLALPQYSSVRDQRDRARQEVRVYEKMMRAIQPLTARQHDALDHLGSQAESELRALCGPEGWKDFVACPVVGQ
jgi:hypothetical protein